MLFKLLIVAAFFNGLSWMILIPVWQYPDEQAHFSQIQYMANYGYNHQSPKVLNTSEEVAISEKVLGTDRDNYGNNKFTYHPEYNLPYSDTNTGYFETYLRSLPESGKAKLVKYEATSNPPLYYFLGTLSYSIFNKSNIFSRIYAIRILSLTIFIGTIYVSYAISKVIFGKDRNLAMLMPAMVAFMPMHVFSSTGVLPDVLTNLLFTTVIFISLKIVSYGPKTTYIAQSISIIILGFFTRQQFVIAIPIAIIAIFWKMQKRISSLIVFAILITFLALLAYFASKFTTVAPLLSEIRIPDSDILGIENISYYSLKNYINFALGTYQNQTFPWYWGVYRWLSLTLPLEYYRLIKVSLLLSMLGIIICFFPWQKKGKFNDINSNYIFLGLISLLYLLFFIVGDYLFYARQGYSFGIQGRYFFPMITAHMSFIVLGLWTISRLILKGYARYTIVTITVVQIIFNNLSLAHVAGSYYSTTNLEVFISQASQYKPDIFKGPMLIIFLLVAVASQFMFTLLFIKNVKNIK